MPAQEIYAKIVTVLVGALSVDPEEVKPTATLQGDLGAESIDFLDIVFRLEREFDIRIERSELFPDAILGGDADFVQNGLITERGMLELRERLPFADVSKLEKNRAVAAIFDLFDVRMIARYIEGKLTAAPSTLGVCAA